MKKMVIPVCVLLLTAFQNEEIKFEIGSTLNSEFIQKSKIGSWIATSSSQLRPYIERKIGGVDFLIAYAEESREIKYIATQDRKFKTASGLQVGHFIKVTKEQIYDYPGWKIHAMKTEDGWTPVIGFLTQLTVRKGDAVVTVDLKEVWQPASEEPIEVKIVEFIKGGN